MAIFCPLIEAGATKDLRLIKTKLIAISGSLSINLSEQKKI